MKELYVISLPYLKAVGRRYLYNVELLMEHTLRLIDNADLRNQLGRNGLQEVQKRFQLSDRINELEKYLTSWYAKGVRDHIILQQPQIPEIGFSLF